MQSEYERVALHIISRLAEDERALFIEAATPARRKAAPTLLETMFAMMVPKYANEIRSELKLRKPEVKLELARQCADVWMAQK